MGNQAKPDNGPGRPPAAPRCWIRPASAAELGVPPRIKKKARVRYLSGTRLGTRNKQTTLQMA